MREIYTARLESKLLLSAPAQCYHFEFRFEGAASGTAPPAIEPGQFLSLLAEDSAGKTYTRAYSIASAGDPHGFALCVNRVDGGFFSNLLCDLAEGATLRCHGPHGLFTLRPPPAEALMIAAGTGIAPMRGFVQALFSETSPRCNPVPQAWLLYEAPQPDELFYDREFRALATREPGFHYLPVEGGHGDHRRLEETLATLGEPGESTAASFPRYAYVCGLSELVKSARTALLALGWQKPQILFERYD